MSTDGHGHARWSGLAAALPRGVALLPAFAATVTMLAVFLAFSPGHYSFDAAYLWWMARHDAFDSTHPPILGLVWQASRLVLPDPQGFFALQLALVGAGLALVASALPLPRPVQALVVVGFVAWPAFGALLPQVWKDVWMVGALLVAVGALLHDHRQPHAGWRGLALLALGFAAALRFNAITGVLPLLAWLLVVDGRASRARGAFIVALRSAVSVTVFAALLIVPAHLARARDVPAWPYVALWDLAAVAIDTGRVDIPPTLLAPQATPQAFATVFRPDTNTTTVGSGLTLYYEERPLTPAERDALLRAWLALPFREPAAWAAHRWRLASHLFGGAPARDPGLALMPGIVPLRDNPPLAAAHAPLAIWLNAAWRSATATPVFEGRWYALVAVLTLVVALRRRRWPAAAVAVSGLAIAAPLLLIAPSAEFRYLLWLVATVPIALLLLRRPADLP